MTFSDISLLPEEFRILRSLKRRGPRTLTEEEKGDAGALLAQYHFIQRENGMYSITKTGRRYLVFSFEDAFRHRWPVYLSIVAVSLSLISLVVSAISLLI